jgi:polyisoprenoid-binding protein YceI
MQAGSRSCKGLDTDDKFAHTSPTERRRLRTIARSSGLVLAAALQVCAPDVTQAADWRMDAAGSKLEYIATLQKARVSGTFRQFDARVRFDPNRPDDSRVDVTVAVTSADMIDPDVNKAIQGPDWFDSAKFPQAVFHADEIRQAGENRYLARGALTLKGIEQQVEVPVVWTDGAGAATITGEFTLKRAAFRIGLGDWGSTDVVGSDVTVKFNVRLRKTE